MKAGPLKTGIPVLLATALLAGCAISSEYRSQDGWLNYVVNCSGPAANFSACIEKASDICRGRGYRVLDVEGGEPPASSETMPPPGLIEAAIKGQIGKEELRKFNIRKLYIRCN